MGPSQICGCPFREPRVFTIAHMDPTDYHGYTGIPSYYHGHFPRYHGHSGGGKKYPPQFNTPKENGLIYKLNIDNSVLFHSYVKLSHGLELFPIKSDDVVVERGSLLVSGFIIDVYCILVENSWGTLSHWVRVGSWELGERRWKIFQDQMFVWNSEKQHGQRMMEV